MHDIIRKLILEEVTLRREKGTPYNSRGIANWLVNTHPDEVAAFVEQTVEELITHQVGVVLSEERARSRRTVNSYNEVSQILPSESAARMVYAINSAGERKEVARFSRNDALYVMGTMKARASTQLAIATWLDNISKDLKEGQVIADILGEQDIDKAYKRLVGRK